jgi:uncharacterized membrane protein YccC
MSTALRQRLRDPVLWTDVSQLVKTVLAAVLAWVAARSVAHVEQPFLAPWAALLTVHATVYRTFARGAQQVGATVIGVLLAFAAGSLLGVTAPALAVVLLGGLLLGSWQGLRAESTTAAATALVVLLSGSGSDVAMLLARLLDTGIGIGVGVAVTVVVWPPLHDRAAARRIDALDERIGELLSEIADTVRGDWDADVVEGWVQRTRELDGEVDDAWATLGQAQESGRLNPRRAAPRRLAASGDFGEVLVRLEQAVAETRSMVRTLGRITGADRQRWAARFREPWLVALGEAGEAVTAAAPARLRAVREALDDLSVDVLDGQRAPLDWPVCGGLIENLRNIADALEGVAAEQPITVGSAR